MLKFIATVALLAATAAPAFAADDLAVPQVRVSYADLDLRHPAGVKQLDQRLHRAVKAVCADRNGEARITWSDIARCRRAALASAADQRAAALASANGAVQLALNAAAR